MQNMALNCVTIPQARHPPGPWR